MIELLIVVSGSVLCASHSPSLGSRCFSDRYFVDISHVIASHPPNFGENIVIDARGESDICWIRSEQSARSSESCIPRSRSYRYRWCATNGSWRFTQFMSYRKHHVTIKVSERCSGIYHENTTICNWDNSFRNDFEETNRVLPSGKPRNVPLSNKALT